MGYCNEPTTPGCKYNPTGVRCDFKDRHCERCGHNPEVAAARLQKRYPGYLATLAPRDPAITEALLSGNWGCPDNG